LPSDKSQSAAFIAKAREMGLDGDAEALDRVMRELELRTKAQDDAPDASDKPGDQGEAK